MEPYESSNGLPSVCQKETYCHNCRAMKWHIVRVLSSAMTDEEIFAAGQRDGNFQTVSRLMSQLCEYQITYKNRATCIRENTCRVCSHSSFDLYINKTGNTYAFYRIHPLFTPSGITDCNQDMPEECQAIYNEAAQIFSLSPRSSSVLLRLCLQKMLESLSIQGSSINEKIRNLVTTDSIPERISQLMDTCRYYGNNAAHFLQLDPEETKDSAESLFCIINVIAEYLFTRPKKTEELYNTIPQHMRDKIQERDSHK